MKNIVILSLFMVTGIMVHAQMTDLVVNTKKYHFTIKAPAGAVVTEQFGQLKITAGNGYSLEVSDGYPTSVASKKAELAKVKAYNFKAYVLDTPDGFIYSTTLDTEHLFYAKKIGGNVFLFEDYKMGHFTHAQEQAMFDSAKSAK